MQGYVLLLRVEEHERGGVYTKSLFGLMADTALGSASLVLNVGSFLDGGTCNI